MIKVGILGYGNLGRGVEQAINMIDDMELFAVFTRRNPDSLKIKSQICQYMYYTTLTSYLQPILLKI